MRSGDKEEMTCTSCAADTTSPTRVSDNVKVCPRFSVARSTPLSRMGLASWKDVTVASPGAFKLK